MLISVQNNIPDNPLVQSSYLQSAISAGGTTSVVRNQDPFSTQRAVQIGRTGEAQAEILVVSGAPSGGTVNYSSAARFNHSVDTPIFDIHYDKIIFKRSTSGTTGTASAIATVTLEPSQLYTDYDDTSGVATYAYKTQYYNSVSGDTSTESDWFVPGGPTFYSLQKLRDRIKGALSDSGYLSDDTKINDWINEWVEMETNVAIKINEGYSMGTAQYSFGTAGLGTITEPLFKNATKIEITTNGTDFTPSTEIPVNRFNTLNLYNALSPRHAWTGDTTFQIIPYGTSGTARFSLSLIFSPLSSDGDLLPQFLRGYTTGCVEYGLYRAYDADLKDAQADKHYARFLAQEKKFEAQITPRDQTGPKSIDLVESLSGMQETLLGDSDWLY